MQKHSERGRVFLPVYITELLHRNSAGMHGERDITGLQLLHIMSWNRPGIEN